MEISKTNTGASTYAMKKAMEMPNLLLSLVRQTVDSNGQLSGGNNTTTDRRADLAAVSDKGGIIDISA